MWQHYLLLQWFDLGKWAAKVKPRLPKCPMQHAPRPHEAATGRGLTLQQLSLVEIDPAGPNAVYFDANTTATTALMSASLAAILA